MRIVAPFLLALAAPLLAGCITTDVEPAAPQWSFTTEDGQLTAVSVPGAAAPAPQAAPQQAPGPQVAPQQAPAPTGAAPTAPTPVDDELLALISPATRADLDPDLLADVPPSPFHRMGRSVIRGIDGSWSKLYALKSERSSGVLSMLRVHVPDFPPPDVEDLAGKLTILDQGVSESGLRWVLHRDFYKDSTGKLGVRDALVSNNVGDLLVVTAPPETLLFIDQLLAQLLADVPQIEIEVRIVEVNLDDLIDWDTKIGLAELEDPNAPFDPTTNPPAGGFGSGFPILDDNQPTGFGTSFGSFAPPTSLSGFLLSLQGVRGDLNVNALLSLLQSIGASELISAPTVTVLNGHRAIINTGQRVPVFEATGLGNNAQIVTKYQDTGVRVELIPFIVGEDVVRIDLSVDVSAVTAEVTLVLAGTEVQTPIISTRDAGTTVHVHSGQVVAVGGLRARETLETITKVPLLGDIPVLGWLFKSRSSRKRNSEIVFFITPRIKTPSETLVAPF